MEERVRCDACGREFAISHSHIARDGITCSYIACPACGKKYPYLVTDGALLEMMKDYKDASERTGDPVEAEARAIKRRVIAEKMNEHCRTLLVEHPMEWFEEHPDLQLEEKEGES